MKNQKTEFEKQCEKVLRCIGHNSESPTMCKTIQGVSGLTRRQVTDCIRELRKEYPICSTKYPPGGYWFGSKLEMISMFNVMHAEANTLLQTAENVQNQIEQMEW